MKTLRMRTRYDEIIVSPSVGVPREQPENQLGRGINHPFFLVRSYKNESMEKYGMRYRKAFEELIHLFSLLTEDLERYQEIQEKQREWRTRWRLRADRSFIFLLMQTTSQYLLSTYLFWTHFKSEYE